MVLELIMNSKMQCSKRALQSPARSLMPVICYQSCAACRRLYMYKYCFDSTAWFNAYYPCTVTSEWNKWKYAIVRHILSYVFMTWQRTCNDPLLPYTLIARSFIQLWMCKIIYWSFIVVHKESIWTGVRMTTGNNFW